MVIDGDGEESAGQFGKQDGESKQLVEAAFEGGHPLGQVGAEQVPKGLILGVGVKSLDGVGEGFGAGGGPDENAPEHQGCASNGILELKDRQTMIDGMGVDIGRSYAT